MKDILNSYSVKELKKFISNTNIKKYSKLSKNELIDLMITEKEKFNHIKIKEVKMPLKKKLEVKKPVEVKQIPLVASGSARRVKKKVEESPKVEPKKPEIDEKYIDNYLIKHFPYLKNFYKSKADYFKYTTELPGWGTYKSRAVNGIFEGNHTKVEKYIFEMLAKYIKSYSGCKYDLHKIITEINQFSFISPDKKRIYSYKLVKETLKEFNEEYNFCNNEISKIKKDLPEKVFNTPVIQSSIEYLKKDYEEFYNTSLIKNAGIKLDRYNKKFKKLENKSKNGWLIK